LISFLKEGDRSGDISTENRHELPKTINTGSFFGEKPPLRAVNSNVATSARPTFSFHMFSTSIPLS